MIRDSIEALVNGSSLTVEEAADAMTEIMTGEATPAQFGAFVTALRLKGETAQEIAGMGAFSLGMISDFEAMLERYGAPFYKRLFWETGLIGQVLYLEAEAAGLRSTGIGCFFDDPVHAAFGLANAEFQSLYHFTVGGAVEDDRLTTLPAYPDLQRSPG